VKKYLCPHCIRTLRVKSSKCYFCGSPIIWPKEKKIDPRPVIVVGDKKKK
jgi:hypothetical protein